MLNFESASYVKCAYQCLATSSHKIAKFLSLVQIVRIMTFLKTMEWLITLKCAPNSSRCRLILQSFHLKHQIQACF